MKKADIIEKLHSFPYDTKDYWVITGGAMVMYGKRPLTSISDVRQNWRTGWRKTDSCIR